MKVLDEDIRGARPHEYGRKLVAGSIPIEGTNIFNILNLFALVTRQCVSLRLVI